MVDQSAEAMSPADNLARLRHLVVPRALTWVTSTDGTGRWTAAPFDTMVPVPGPPARVCLLLPRGPSGERTTTEQYLAEVPAFVSHVVDERHRDEALETTETWREPHDAEQALGLRSVAGTRVPVPRLAAAVAAFECRILSHDDVPGGGAGLVVAEVVHWHLAEALGDQVVPNLHKLRPVGAVGGHRYAPVREMSGPLRPPHLRDPEA